MAKITLENVSVEYPIYHANSMSLRNKIVSLSTGGIIKRGTNNIVSVQAINDLSLELNDGDRVGLIGHNGAGKSTLLRTLAGIYSPSKGLIFRDGKVSTILELGAGIDRELTGYENIIRMAMFMGETKTNAKKIIPDIEQFSELGSFLEVPVHTYSAGMLTRLAFGVATAVSPDILLVDEVIGAGDENFQKKARSRLENLIHSSKIFVLASHSDEIIKRFCNRTLEFEHGKLIRDSRITR